MVRSLEEGLKWYEVNKKPDQILWIFGGASIYEQTLKLWDEVYLTLIEREVEGDRRFPEFESSFNEVERTGFTSSVQGRGLVVADDTDVGNFSFIRYQRRQT
jgi:dihydrofolate reductase